MKKLMITTSIIIGFLVSHNEAGDVDFYGSINLGAWWLKYERFYDDVIYTEKDTIWDTINWIPVDIIENNIYGGDTLPGTNANFLPFGWFGCKFRADRFEACVEFGVDKNIRDVVVHGNATVFRVLPQKNLGIYLRKWYFVWYINEYFDLLAGQDYSPANLFGASNQVFWDWNSFVNMGCLYTSRRPMIQFSAHDPDNRIEGKIAVAMVDTTTIWYHNSATLFDEYEREWKIPKLEGSFSLNLETNSIGIRFQCAGGFQTYKSVFYSDELPLEEQKTDITSYVFGADIGLKLWNLIHVSYDVFHGQNIGCYGVRAGDPFGFWRRSIYNSLFYPIDHGQSDEEDRIKNGNTTAMCVIAGFRPKDFLFFEAGGGTLFGNHEYEEFKNSWTHKTYAWYFQTELTAVDKITFTPEIGQYVYGPKKGFGRYLYYGMKTGIEF